MNIHDQISAHCASASVETIEDKSQVVVVSTEDLFTAAHTVREAGYTILSLLSAYDRGDHFGVIYAFLRPAATPEEFGEVRLRVKVPKSVGDGDNARKVEPQVPSLCDLWMAANWQEREMYDMYGIQFTGHPDLRRMFLPEDWTGFPMRKDYKEPEQFVALREGEDITLKVQEEGSW